MLMLFLKFSSFNNFNIASLICLEFSLSTIIPVLSFITTSGWPPTLVTITGIPQACASTAATPKLSLNDGNTAISKLLNTFDTSFNGIRPKNSTESSKVMLERINAQNAEGVEVLSYKLLPDDAKNAMSVVAGADYKVYTDLFNQNMLDAFMNQDQIIVLKKTKKSEKEVNIKPLIYNIKLEDDGIFMQVAQGSASNLKPDLVMDAFAKFAQVTLPEYVTYERLDMYCLEDDNLVSLDDIGGNIE